MNAPVERPQRSMLLVGLKLVVMHPAALLWTYVFNLALAVLFSLRLHAQMASVLDHSMAAERLNTAFDLGTLGGLVTRLSHQAPDPGSSGYAGLPIYLLIYFVLVPGTLFSYQADAPARLGILLSSGLSFFWRFVRVTVLTGIVGGVVLGPMLWAYNRWSDHVDEQVTGVAVYWQTWPVLVLIVLVAMLLRLYFDLVEVYTVQLGEQMRPNGKADKRVRRVLLPALRTLRHRLARAYVVFVLLAALGVAGVLVTGRIALHMLAQPRVWPMFLLAQAGMFGMLLTRFWQRGAETVLACDNRLPAPALSPGMSQMILNESIRYRGAAGQMVERRLRERRTEERRSGERRVAGRRPEDALSDPEPAAPSLDEPDAGVFGHEVKREDDPDES